VPTLPRLTETLATAHVAELNPLVASVIDTVNVEFRVSIIAPSASSVPNFQPLITGSVVSTHTTGLDEAVEATPGKPPAGRACTRTWYLPSLTGPRNVNVSLLKECDEPDGDRFVIYSDQ
jgi:hypothetical protein